MTLPEQAVREFQVAWRLSFNEELNYEQAEAEGKRLIKTHDRLLEVVFNHRNRSSKLTYVEPII